MQKKFQNNNLNYQDMFKVKFVIKKLRRKERRKSKKNYQFFKFIYLLNIFVLLLRK
jgi:hypothetical protein